MWYIFTHIEHIPCAHVMHMVEGDSVYRKHVTCSDVAVLREMNEKQKSINYVCWTSYFLTDTKASAKSPPSWDQTFPDNRPPSRE